MTSVKRNINRPYDCSRCDSYPDAMLKDLEFISKYSQISGI